MTRTSWAEAVRLAYDAGSPVPPERLPLADAAGRRLESDVVALCAVPHYASSAMDGWAVRGSGPWSIAGPHSPVSSPLLDPGEAAPILTGGALPPGTDAVLRSEHGILEPGGRMLVLADAPDAVAPPLGRHIRPAGEEAVEGEIVLRAGRTLTPIDLAVAASCGHDTVEVGAVPRVRLVLTGDEVVTHGIPAAGHVRDSFGLTLPTLIAHLGGRVVETVRLPDSRPSLQDALRAARRADAAASALGPALIITTGGTGDSSADHLRPALADLGAEILLAGIALRPGGPTLLARLPDGTLVLGLPGNPLAAMMGLITAGRPLLAALSGSARPETSTRTLGTDIGGAPGATVLMPCTSERAVVTPTAWRASGMLRGLAGADGVLVCPPGGLAAGAAVEVLPVPWAIPAG